MESQAKFSLVSTGIVQKASCRLLLINVCAICDLYWKVRRWLCSLLTYHDRVLMMG